MRTGRDELSRHGPAIAEAHAGSGAAGANLGCPKGHDNKELSAQ